MNISNDEGQEGLWDTKDVAAYLKYKPYTVRKMVRLGRIPVVKIGRQNRFVPDVIRRKFGRQ